MAPNPPRSLWTTWGVRVAILAMTAGVLYHAVQRRARRRNQEIALALLRVYQHVATRVPLPTTDPAMISLLEGLSRWNVGSPHFNVAGMAAEVEYHSRIGPFHWTRSDTLQLQEISGRVWNLSQTHTLLEPRFRWLGSQTIITSLLTGTNDIESPRPLSPAVLPR